MRNLLIAEVLTIITLVPTVLIGTLLGRWIFG